MATEPETPSPDVMEVWREARAAYYSGPVTVHEASGSLLHIGSSGAAANIIAEAKARWEREAFEKAAQIIASVQPDEEAAGCQASWGDFIQLAQSAIRDGG